MNEITRDLGISTGDLPVDELTPLDELVRKEATELMGRAISWMPDQHAEVWRDRHMVPGPPASYRAVGEKMGLSHEGVRLFHKRALRLVEHAFAVGGNEGLGQEWLRERQAGSPSRRARCRGEYSPPPRKIRMAERCRWLARAGSWYTPWWEVADAAWMAEFGYTHAQIHQRRGWSLQQTRIRLYLARSRMITRLEGGLCNLIQGRKENGETDQT